ncbi:hypothetical protein SAMN02194393_00506 [Maledivibacter halophilus]|uniref:Nucleotidyltransferase domain-containing protein n=2 Tax=Maledivibacter halophilus TaxID=36842 RepID=A0A1T5IL37_9FIRM|nr:hypothetical protein SAMN02194393_00506 [Maledivibacter halophilus]
MNILGALHKKIEKIIEDEKVLSVLLIGSAAELEKEEEFNTLKDIDLFVITDEEYEFEREVMPIEDVLFDISYMSFNTFKNSIVEGIPFLINSLQSYKIIYNNINKELKELLDKIKIIYGNGPKKFQEDDIEYIRFKFYQDLEDIYSRKKDVVNTKFLMNSLFYNILNSYFKLAGYWVPKDKKLLKNIQKFDDILYNLSVGFIEEEDFNVKLKNLKVILDYVLKPYGGVNKFWKRKKFPLI